MYSEAKVGLRVPNKFFAIVSFDSQSQSSWSQLPSHPSPTAREPFLAHSGHQSRSQHVSPGSSSERRWSWYDDDFVYLQGSVAFCSSCLGWRRFWLPISNLLWLASHKLGVGTLPIIETLDFSPIFRFLAEGVAWRKRITLIRNSKKF